MESDNTDTRRKFFEEYKTFAEEVLFPTQKEVKEIFDDRKQPEYWRPADSLGRP